LTGAGGVGQTGDSGCDFDLSAVQVGLAGTQFGGRVRHFLSVGSTNAVALEAAQAGLRTGVFVADEQTAGRGRGGHQWHSASHEGLYVSALVTVAVPMSMGLWLSLAAGLAAQAAIAEVTGLRVDIRWPNDLLLNEKKCGGILVETSVDAAQGMMRYAVIGIGINVNHENFPEELQAQATSLRRESGAVVKREAVTIALLRALDDEIGRLTREYEGTLEGAGLLERFARASSWVRGKRVRVEEGGGYTGVTDGLDSRGFLRVAGDDGTGHTVLSGGVRAI
jgi:BirA family transcriptional regulator, biotin operon repressor / biotin---[acetyl-CoA-carboxylase] ligase